jgi:hypothetical protein
MGWKYIMVLNKIGDTKFLVPVIFPDKLVHADVYTCLKPTMPAFQSRPGWGIKAVSAGKIEHIEIDGLGDRSDTLNLDANTERDTNVIQTYSYLHGVV